MRLINSGVISALTISALFSGCEGLDLDLEGLLDAAEVPRDALGLGPECNPQTENCEAPAQGEPGGSGGREQTRPSFAEDAFEDRCDGECERYAVNSGPNRSSTIALSEDDALLAMVNTDDGSVSFFDARAGKQRLVSTATSSKRALASEPMSVALHPSQPYAFVANRATGTVSRIAGVYSTAPRVDAEVELGGEPIGLALDPKGEKLWVTNWVSGQVHVIDAATMELEYDVAVGGNPWAIAITNDGDEDTDDEKVLVTQFYGRRRAVVLPEGTDDGREGVVQVIDTYDYSKVREIVLDPLERCFASPDLQSGCFPNQLLGITIREAFGRTLAFVVSVAASPGGPVQFNHNVQALVSVIDVRDEYELADLTTNVNQGVARQLDDDGDDTVGRRFLNVPNAIEFENRRDALVGYVTAAGSDIAVRVEYQPDGKVEVGTPTAFNIPTGQNPTGLVITHRREEPLAFVSNLISRDLSVLSLRREEKIADILSTELPPAGTPEFEVWRGKRFFNTSTGIWSKEGWGSCQGCHPMGLTDNVTWQFAAGPRQTIALDGQFASDDPTDMRALNWTAVFDETDDFENNTRGVSGGTGAIRNQAGPIVSEDGAPAFTNVLMEDGWTTENHQALNGSMNFLSRNEEVCDNEETCPDWDQIDSYIQTIRSASAYVADRSAAARGREVFEGAGCQKCHAGPKWTVSQTFYTPELFSGELGFREFEANRARRTPLDASPLQAIGLAWDVNVDETLIAGDDSDGGAPALLRQACNVRNVKTFGARGGALEVRDNGQPAQGRNGFNPPSLLSIATGAPYFHNGAAEDLQALFEERFYDHLTAGSEHFYPDARERADLAAFLLSIDETTRPFDVLEQSVICPLDFSENLVEDYDGGGNWVEEDGYDDYGY